MTLKMLTAIDPPMLAAAFPSEYAPSALAAGADVALRLAPRQWTERFAVDLSGQPILIPARLHFTSHHLGITFSEDAWIFARALQTRSNDGFERQRAARDLLTDVRPWTAPFIVALIGEYLVEIIEDILAALTPEVERALATFIIENAAYWNTTKRRVTSYWNAYYRSSLASDLRRAYGRDEYPGYRLVDRLDEVVHRCATSSGDDRLRRTSAAPT